MEQGESDYADYDDGPPNDTSVAPAPDVSWQQLDDPEYGTYFYNSISGETRWDSPWEESQRHDAGYGIYQDSSTTNSSIGLTDAFNQVASVDESVRFVADDGTVWIWDGNTGQYIAEEHYYRYYSGAEQQSHSSFDAGDTSASDSLVVNAAVSSGAGDWVEVDSPDGRYFYNTVTMESAWELPQADLAAHETNSISAEPSTTGSDQEIHPELRAPQERTVWDLLERRTSQPGRWLASDHIVNKAVKEYDSLLTLDPIELKRQKGKGTSLLVRQLVGPEDGEDDEDDIELSSSDSSSQTDELVNMDPSIFRIFPWQPTYAPTGEMYFYNSETGESTWHPPLATWEAKAQELGALTPRVAEDPGRGSWKIRDSSPLRGQRLKQLSAQSPVHASEGSTRDEDSPEGVEELRNVMDDMISVVEQRFKVADRKRARRERRAERAVWNPAAQGYAMERLVLRRDRNQGESKENKLARQPVERDDVDILSDATFYDMKITGGGSSLPWVRSTLPTDENSGKVADMVAKKQLSPLRSPLSEIGLRVKSAMQRAHEEYIQKSSTAAKNRDGRDTIALLLPSEPSIPPAEVSSTGDSSEFALLNPGAGAQTGDPNPAEEELLVSPLDVPSDQNALGGTTTEERDKATALDPSDPLLASGAEDDAKETKSGLRLPGIMWPSLERPHIGQKRNRQPPADGEPKGDVLGGGTETNSSPTRRWLRTRFQDRSAAARAQVVEDERDIEDLPLGDETTKISPSLTPNAPSSESSLLAIGQSAALRRLRWIQDQIHHVLEQRDFSSRSDFVSEQALSRNFISLQSTDTTRLTLVLGCCPPPMLQSETVSSLDARTGEKTTKTVLSSGLRDKWEELLTEDVARASGLPHDAVSIEEILVGMDHQIVTSAPHSSFRPERRDETMCTFNVQHKNQAGAFRNAGEAPTKGTTAAAAAAKFGKGLRAATDEALAALQVELSNWKSKGKGMSIPRILSPRGRPEQNGLILELNGTPSWKVKGEMLKAAKPTLAERLPSKESLRLAVRAERVRRLFKISDDLLDSTCIVHFSLIARGQGGPPAGSKLTTSENAASLALKGLSEWMGVGPRPRLLQGVITRTALKGWWTATGRGRIMDGWEGYWCQSISPVFFGYSSERRLSACRLPKDINGDEDNLGGTHQVPHWLPQVGGANAQLEQAELELRSLMKQGLSSDGRLSPEQFRALLVRDRAKKKVLLRRKIDAKRKMGRLRWSGAPFSCPSPTEINSWIQEVQSDRWEKIRMKRTEDIRLRKERRVTARNRERRGRLRSWILSRLSENSDELVRAALTSPSGAEVQPTSPAAEVTSSELTELQMLKSAKRRFELDTATMMRSTYRRILLLDPAAVTISKRKLLQILNDDAELRKAALRSPALSPLLEDAEMAGLFLAHREEAHSEQIEEGGEENKTDFVSEDEFVIWGSVLAEVAKVVKVTRAKVEQQRKKMEEENAQLTVIRRNQAALRDKRRDTAAPPPSEKWRAALKTERTAQRGDGREWERFHHHLLIPDLKNSSHLYCCVCRERRWEQARRARMATELSYRDSFKNVVNSRAELCQGAAAPVLLLEVAKRSTDIVTRGCAFALDKALSSIVAVQDENYEATMKDVADYLQRAAPKLRKVMLRLPGESSLIFVSLDAALKRKVRRNVREYENLTDRTLSRSTRSTDLVMAIETALGLSDWGTCADGCVKLLSMPPAGEKEDDIRQWLTPASAHVAGCMKRLAKQAVTKLREEWEAQERERCAMMQEEEILRRQAELLTRSAEWAARHLQENGRCRFFSTIQSLQAPHPSLRRLCWEYAPLHADASSGSTDQVMDPAGKRRMMCRIIPCTNSDQAMRIVRAASMLQDISHRRLVRVWRAFPHAVKKYAETGEMAHGGHFVVVLTEFCGGGKLEDRIQHLLRPSCSESAACAIDAWVQQVTHALAALHREGVLHRNINAGNVYLDAHGRAKLGSYACLRSEEGLEGYSCLSTMPPEVEAGTSPTAAADIWGLGCSIYRWVTGRDFTPAEDLGRALKRVPLPLKKSLGSTIRMCLQSQPESRPTAERLWQVMNAQARP